MLDPSLVSVGIQERSADSPSGDAAVGVKDEGAGGDEVSSARPRARCGCAGPPRACTDGIYQTDTRPAPNAAKRKHQHLDSPPAQSESPAPSSVVYDSPAVAPLPLFTAHTANLPPSEFEFITTRSHPSNKNSFRYTPCGPSPSSSHRPIAIQHTIESAPQGIRFSWEDKSSFILATEDGKTITAEKGWRAARANVGVREGNWYWEYRIERGGGEGGRTMGGAGEGSWVRVGVARRESPLNAPVGFDGHSYAYRDKGGEAVSLGRPQPYGAPYASGSTIGIYLSIPPRPVPLPSDRRDPSHIVRKRVPIRYKGQLYFESLEFKPSKEMEALAIDPAHKAKLVVEEAKAAAPGMKSRPAIADATPPPRDLPKLAQSRIAFFLDGVCQGVAFEDIYDYVPLRLHPGTREKKHSTTDVHLQLMENWHDDGAMGYFPFASVFGGGIVSMNAGPEFAFPPPADIESVLTTSPHPPLSLPIVFPPSSPDASTPWRPLCDRYPEFLVEQHRLDMIDEAETIRVQDAAILAQAAAVAKGEVAAAKKSRNLAVPSRGTPTPGLEDIKEGGASTPPVRAQFPQPPLKMQFPQPPTSAVVVPVVKRASMNSWVDGKEE